MKKTYMQMVKEYLADDQTTHQDAYERGSSIRESEIELCRLTDLARLNRQKNAVQSKTNQPTSIDLFEYTPQTQLESALATLKRLSISDDVA